MAQGTYNNKYIYYVLYICYHGSLSSSTAFKTRYELQSLEGEQMIFEQLINTVKSTLELCRTIRVFEGYICVFLCGRISDFHFAFV